MLFEVQTSQIRAIDESTSLSLSFEYLKSIHLRMDKPSIISVSCLHYVWSVMSYG